jgi:hypothetical protein
MIVVKAKIRRVQGGDALLTIVRKIGERKRRVCQK